MEAPLEINNLPPSSATSTLTLPSQVSSSSSSSSSSSLMNYDINQQCNMEKIMEDLEGGESNANDIEIDDAKPVSQVDTETTLSNTLKSDKILDNNLSIINTNNNHNTQNDTNKTNGDVMSDLPSLPVTSESSSEDMSNLPPLPTSTSEIMTNDMTCDSRLDDLINLPPLPLSQTDSIISLSNLPPLPLSQSDLDISMSDLPPLPPSQSDIDITMSNLPPLNGSQTTISTHSQIRDFDSSMNEEENSITEKILHDDLSQPSLNILPKPTSND